MSYVTFVELNGAVNSIRFRTLRAARSAAWQYNQTGAYKAVYAWRA
jgi:hypothetical protein